MDLSLPETHGTIEMDTTTHNPTHVLSGHNPTLFDVVLQYADMDMLRALVLTSLSMYETLQQCQFNHLTMVVLEAPVLKEQQPHIIYNGADPVPADTFELPPNDDATTPLVEEPSPEVPPRTTGFARETTKQQGPIIRNAYGHNLIIPNYARNFMARAQSVELVVYRRRLGTRISALFIENAHHLKHGGHTDADECDSCVESRKTENMNTQYKQHVPRIPVSQKQHCITDGERIHGDDDKSGCVFSEHCSHEYFEGDAAESRRVRLHATPNAPQISGYRFPYDDLPPLRLKYAHHATGNVLAGEATSSFNTQDQTDGLLYLPTVQNTLHYRPYLQNLPLEEQQAPTTSFRMHIVDCVSFGADDWCNAIPGCMVQPVQTWVIRDGANAHQRHFGLRHNDRPSADFNIGRHFPCLTGLVLQYSRLDDTNRCNIDNFKMPDHIGLAGTATLSHFFIGREIRLPHLQHFGVIGTILGVSEYAAVAFNNASVTSLNIDPGLQPTDSHYISILLWLENLTGALDKLEGLGETNQVDYYARFFNPPTLQRALTIPRPRRKYNFSFDFASPRLTHHCPHEAQMLAQKASANTQSQTDVTTPGTIPTNQDFSQFGQHAVTCAVIHDSLAKFYWDHTNDSENGNTHCVPTSESAPLQLVFTVPTDVGSQEALPVLGIARLAQRTFTHLTLRCHYCSHTIPVSTVFPGASASDCVAAHPPPPADALLSTVDLQQDGENTLAQTHSTQQFDRKMHMRLRQLLLIPSHVVLHL